MGTGIRFGPSTETLTLLRCRPEFAEMPPWSIFSSVIHEQERNVSVFHPWLDVELAVPISGALPEGPLSVQIRRDLGSQPPDLQRPHLSPPGGRSEPGGSAQAGTL